MNAADKCGRRCAGAQVQRTCARASLHCCTPAPLRVSHGGFTLIEVLVALIIVSLGMLGVIQAVSQTASNTSYLRDKTIAHWVAMNRLAEVRLDPRPPGIDKTSGEVDMAGRKWRWTMEVTQTPVETMRRIDIRVRPEEADEDSSLSSLIGFYGTAVAQPGAIVTLWEGGGASGTPGERDDSETDDSETDDTQNRGGESSQQ